MPLVAGAAGAATTLLDARMSPDVSVDLSGSGVAGAEVAFDDLTGGVSALGFPDLPAGVDVVGYQQLAGGVELLVVDTSFELSGGSTVDRGDVMRLYGGVYTVEFDASAAGVPASAIVDAVARTSEGLLLLSFDTSLSFGAFTADDEDLVRWDGVSFTELEFDASAAGISKALDLDAAHLAANGHILLSFDGSGSVAGFYFDDEDVLEYDPIAASWELALDSSILHPTWKSVDLGALSLSSDSDDDALADRVETDTGVYAGLEDTGSDPLAADSDGDGFDDGVEVEAGFDPNDPLSYLPAAPATSLLGQALLAGLLAGAALREQRRKRCT